MTSENTRIEWNGEHLHVKGNYSAGDKGCMYGLHPSPPEPPEFEIGEIEWNGLNVTDLLTSSEAIDEEISASVIEALEDSPKDDGDRAYDASRDVAD